MIRPRRLWLVPAFFFTCLFYYLFLWPSDPPLPPPYEPRPAGGRVNSDLHWVKQPERYPIDVLQQLPTGPLAAIPRIQHQFDAETPAALDKRMRRLASVREAFLHAWTGYKTYAWEEDEVTPLGGRPRTTFGGWGATLVDTMDTLWIMGLTDDFEMCVDAVAAIDFTTNEEEFLNVFETTIRYMGGLLSAYDLSGTKYPVLLQKAAELGEILYSAFDTPNHMPQSRWQWRKSAVGGQVVPGTTTLLAELGSLTVEFTRLSQLTGDPKYFDIIERIAGHMQAAQSKTLIAGLWPTLVDAVTLKFDYNHFTLGGMADSTYEYLPKQYMMLGGRDLKWKQMYETAIEAAKRYLFFRPMVPQEEDILFSGNAALSGFETIPVSMNEPQGQHLGCFTGGMVAIGAKIFSRPDDLAVARRLVDGCIWAYKSMPSGLMPETFHLASCQVGAGEAPEGKCAWSYDKWYEAIAKYWPDMQETEGLTNRERGKLIATSKDIKPGYIAHGDNRYILRPEAIESIFILYRITGDVKLLDEAWTMFEAINRATRTRIANAAVHDVRKQTPDQSDRMESFWLAETLKYFYLIFADPELISLDEWVLNTEAHPFKRPTS